MWKDWNFWFTFFTAITAIIALVMTGYQIRLSNKQHLFERRLRDFMIISGLISLCKENQKFLVCKREDRPQFAMDLEFLWLTNNSFREGQVEAIRHPLEQPYHKEFLKKCEELRTLSTEISLIFRGKEAEFVSNFVLCYEQAIFEIYKYQIMLNNINKENDKHPMTEEEVQRRFSEKPLREQLYNSFYKLNDAYKDIISLNAEQKIRKQIKLIKK